MEADISQLEAPTFTTLQRGPPEPMVRLDWNHKVNLIGEKVLNPMIHCCDTCLKPILIYGRMIPCKHVFCLKCARIENLKVCPRCKEKAVRVEQTGLGTVFMCTHGGTRYGNTGCRRTYLSQRDLQAHINHRHVSTPASATSTEKSLSDTKVILSPNAMAVPTSGQRKMLPSDISQNTRVSTRNNPTPFAGVSVSAGSAFPAAPTNRTNLITVPIQDSQQQQQQSILSNAMIHAHNAQMQQQPPPLPTSQQSQQMGDIQQMTYYAPVGYVQNAYAAQSQQAQSNSNYGSTNQMSIPPPSTTSQQGPFYSGYGQQNFNHYQANQQQQQQQRQQQPFDHSHQQQQINNNYGSNIQQWQQQQYYR